MPTNGRGVSLNPENHAEERNSAPTLEQIDHKKAKELANLPFQEFLSTYAPPSPDGYDTRIDLRARPISLYVATTSMSRLYGSKVLKYLSVVAWGLALSDKELQNHGNCVARMMSSVEDLSEDEQVDAVIPRVYITNMKYLPKVRTKYPCWSKEVLSGLGDLASRNNVNLSALSVVYLSAALLKCHEQLGGASAVVLKRELAHWRDWLSSDTGRTRAVYKFT